MPSQLFALCLGVCGLVLESGADQLLQPDARLVAAVDDLVAKKGVRPDGPVSPCWCDSPDGFSS